MQHMTDPAVGDTCPCISEVRAQVAADGSFRDGTAHFGGIDAINTTDPEESVIRFPLASVGVFV